MVTGMPLIPVSNSGSTRNTAGRSRFTAVVVILKTIMHVIRQVAMILGGIPSIKTICSGLITYSAEGRAQKWKTMGGTTKFSSPTRHIRHSY